MGCPPHKRRLRRLLVGVVSAAGLAAGSGAAGFWYGRVSTLESSPSGRAVAALETTLRQQLRAIDGVKDESRTNLDALGARVGELQGELMRLNALGDRLVRMAGLSEDEFDFADPAPMGGPEQPSETHIRVKELADAMSDLLRNLEDRENKLGMLEQMIMERHLDKQMTPTGKPVRSGYITAPFGFRLDPFSGRRAFHSGIDFAGRRGSDVLAVADGLVIFTGERHGYGRTVEIRHGNGLVTLYAHNEKILVTDGDLVSRGQAIAKLGATGRTTGPHVHFEVLQDGEAVNPMQYVEGSTKKPAG